MLHFDKGQFDALVSIDSYHYFATRKGFFEEKMLPFLGEKAVVLVGVPGIKDEFTGRSEELLSDWLGNEAYMFQSPSAWREIIGTTIELEFLKLGKWVVLTLPGMSGWLRRTNMLQAISDFMKQLSSHIHVLSVFTSR